jgi:hypothetical protein
MNDPVILNRLLTPYDENVLRQLLENHLKAFQFVTLELQKDSTTFTQVRNYFDELRLRGKCNSLTIPFLKPKFDVLTRWNNTCDMINRALQLKQPLTLLMDELCQETTHFFSLDNSDWEIFSEISLLLKPFKQVTERVCGQQYATFNTVVPLFNFLKDHCNESGTKYNNWRKGLTRSPYRTISSTCEVLKDLIQASKAAYKKFDKYYNIQSDYAIAAVVLDPRLNVSYFGAS